MTVYPIRYAYGFVVFCFVSHSQKVPWDKHVTETETSLGWQPWYSLETLKPVNSKAVYLMTFRFCAMALLWIYQYFFVESCDLHRTFSLSFKGTSLAHSASEVTLKDMGKIKHLKYLHEAQQNVNHMYISWDVLMIPMCRLWLHALYGLQPGLDVCHLRKAVKHNHSLILGMCHMEPQKCAM